MLENSIPIVKAQVVATAVKKQMNITVSSK